VVTEAIVLAGGLGTRLRSVVPDVPKAMSPIAGQPFLAYLLQYLEAQGIARVILAVGYRNEVIRDFFGARYHFFGERYQGLKLVYSVEDEPLGTGGALLEALPSVDGAFAFVLNGDTLLRLNYPTMAAKLEPDTDLVMALRHVADAQRYDAAVVDRGRIQGFMARGTKGPGLINAGCYLVARDIFQRYPMPRKFSWEGDFLGTLTSEIRPIAFECDAPFIDIGIPEALEEAQTLIPEWLSSMA
jgi:D-glycero-alpha-D-manno-heptose 1-phosphate guanylyltransferase